MGQILGQSHQEFMKSPSLKVFKTKMKNVSEQPDLTQSALSKGLEQMGNSGDLF